MSHQPAERVAPECRRIIRIVTNLRVSFSVTADRPRRSLNFKSGPVCDVMTTRL